MLKRLFIASALISTPFAAHADTFTDRLERPLGGDVNFVCQTNPAISVSYYINPTTGKMWTKFWEEIVIQNNPYTSQFIDIEVELPGEARLGAVRRKCGFSPQELQWLRVQTKPTAVNPTIVGPHQGVRAGPRL